MAATLAVGALGSQAAIAQPNERIKLALVSRTVFYAPVWVAQQKGYFEAAGLSVEMEVMDNAEKIAEALRTGAAQIAISTPESVIAESLRGGTMRIIAGNAKKLPHFVIAKPSIKTPAELKGANFGVLSLNEGTTYLVRAYARSIGLGDNDYRISQVGGAPTRWNLLREGKIDAGLQPFPLSYEAEAAGFNNFGAISKIVPDWQFTSVNVDLRWAQSHRAVVERFLGALQRGSSAMAADLGEASVVVAKELRTTPALALRALNDTGTMEILAADWSYSPAGLKRVHESLVETGQVPPDSRFDLDKIVDGSFLAGAKR